jgi:hypothetical protein
MLSVILLLLYLVSVVFGSQQYSLTADDKSKILDYHNQIRANYGLPPLVYNLTLGQQASNYAGNCVWGHSAPGSGKYGENIAQYSKSPAPSFPLTSWMSQVDGWYQEFKYWSCPDGKCGSVCGHLTQIISKVTTSVGCGVADCDAGTITSSMRSQYMVCQYFPPGNVNLGSTHPVSGQPYPYNNCPGSNPALIDTKPPTGPTPVAAPVAPIGTPKEPTPVAPVSPVMPPSAPVAPPTAPYAPPPGKPWAGCKGDYWPGNPPKQQITPCNVAPQTFSTKTGRKLYCDVGDPAGYYWPVINPNTIECNYIALLTEDTAATNVNLPYYYWIGIALGILVFIIIIVAIILIVRKKRSADERV